MRADVAMHFKLLVYNLLSIIAVCVLVLLGNVHLVKAQGNAALTCEEIPTEFSFVSTHWNWRDPNTVVFLVSNLDVAGALIERRHAWYSYQPATRRLERLEDVLSQAEISFSPTLLNFQAGSETMAAEVEAAPTGAQFIYPGMTGERGSYWMADSARRIQVDIGIPTKQGVADIIVATFWSHDGQRAIVQPEMSARENAETKLLTIEGTNVTIQNLSDIPAMQPPNYDGRYFQAIGLSPDGRYAVLFPETGNVISWLIDLETQAFYVLDFSIHSDRVGWDAPDTFVVVTNLGLIRYHIPTQSIEVLVARDQVPVLGTISPDGQFLLGGRREALPSGGFKYSVLLCQIG